MAIDWLTTGCPSARGIGTGCAKAGPGEGQDDAGRKHRRHPRVAHQKTYLTRTSRAYVRSSFCDSTHDNRSLWSYSSRIT